MTESGPVSDTNTPPAPERLDSWKEIASYLRRDESTVRRWEKSEGLPVYRHVHKQRASVFAYRSELDGWLEGGQDVTPAADGAGSGDLSQPAKSGRRTRRIQVALAAGVCAGVIGLSWPLWPREPAEAPAPYRILMADAAPPLVNQSANPAQPTSWTTWLERELAAIPEIDAITREEVAHTFALMRRAETTSIDVAAGREIAMRRGDVDALLSWTVERSGGTPEVILSLADPVDGAVLVTWRENATSGVAPAAARLGRRAVRDLRTRSADLPRHPERTVFGGMEGLRLEDATTSSFEAWRLYAEAMTLHFGFRWRQSAELLQRAITVDPDFATAHVYLGHAYTNLDAPDRAAERYRRAFELGDAVTDRERYFVHAAYFEHVVKDPARAADAYSTLLLLYPDHYWGVIYATWFHSEHGGAPRVVEYLTRYAEARPDHLEMILLAAQAQGGWSDNPVWAERYVSRARDLLNGSANELLAGPVPVARLGPGRAAWLALRPVYDRWRNGDAAGALGGVSQASGWQGWASEMA